MTKRSPFRYFKTSPEIIRLAVMLYIRFPLSLRNVEDLLHERGIEISHETVRFWWNRFGPMLAAEIRAKRVEAMRAHRHWQWHLDEVYVKINGVTQYLWRAVDHEGEVLESIVTKTRDRKAALKFLKKSMKRHGRPETIVTDRLRSYGAALKDLGRGDDREMGRWLNNRAENSHLPFRRRERAMLRFRRMHTLQKFASVHASVHDHFPAERHLQDRNAYKQTGMSPPDAGLTPVTRSGRGSRFRPRTGVPFSHRVQAPAKIARALLELTEGRTWAKVPRYARRHLPDVLIAADLPEESRALC
jgi:putative transposase